MLIIALLFSFVAIFGIPPAFLQHGVLVKGVDSNSTFFADGLRSGMVVTSINNIPINDLNDYHKFLNLFEDNKTHKMDIVADKVELINFYSFSDISGITVTDIPSTNIKVGLDLQGGARAIVKAKDRDLSSSEITDLVAVTSNRLNQFGISDITVTPVSDLEGHNYMLVEIAGATTKDLQDILSKQGKFEAKIGNETVFVGGEQDIASVSRNAQDAYIQNCGQNGNGYACTFIFSIYLSQSAAERHANITGRLGVNASNPGYLSKPLDLYLDDKLVESLLIGKDLQGRVTTQVAVSGSGTGPTQQDAYNDAEANMKKLQTILITGSLPYQLEIVKLDSMSPLLGQNFIKFILLAGLTSIVAVAVVIFVRYRKLRSSLALLLTSFSEIVIILGVASLIEWNLDLPSIAGILATIGTGIDSQIIILDESKQKNILSVKEKLKRAFATILGSYFTALVSLLPLIWAGAGLLKGFAITSIIGITIGILITRPAFIDMVKRIEE